MESIEGEKKHKQLKNLLQVFLAVRGFAIALVLAAHVAISFVAAEASLTPIRGLTPVFSGYWQIVSPINFIIMELCRLAVPLFLFLAGYHLARSPRSMKAIYNNCKNIVVPVLVWSLFAWGISWRKGSGGWGGLEFISLLLSGKAQLGYYFIILIIQFYILSRWAVPLIGSHAILAIASAVLIQLSIHIYDYLYLLGKLGLITNLGFIVQYGTFPEFLFPRFIVSFFLGIWASLNLDEFKRITEKKFFFMTIMTLFFGILLLLETGLIFGYSHNHLHATVFQSASNAWGEWKLTTAFWGISATFFIIAASRRYLPIKRHLEKLGKYSLQILLLHGMVIHFMLLFCYKYLSSLYWYGKVGFVAWFLITIYASLAGIKIIEKSLPFSAKKILLGL